jgi:hypothetical protein
MRSREQSREYMRQYRARKAAEVKAAADAVILQMPPPAPVTTVQSAVRRELDSLTATPEHEGSAAVAMRLAAILDDEGQAIHFPATARALGEVLVRMHKASVGRSGGKLMAMRLARRDE